MWPNLWPLKKQNALTEYTYKYKREKVKVII